MRKTILMLINGFGIEKKGSLEVYSASLMPNMDKMTKTQLFGSLQTNASDYNSGYKLFSMGEGNKEREDKIDQMIFDKVLANNEILKETASTLNNDNKLHIFYTLRVGSKIHQLREIIKILNPNKDKKVFVHLILTATSINDYQDIVKAISKLSFEMGGYAKIGFIVGKNKVNSDDVLRTFYKEFGEHWNESTKKFDVFVHDVVNPEDAPVFYINNGFAIKEGDTLFFANFENVNLDKFYTEFTKMSLHMYSLYEFMNAKNAFTREKEETEGINTLLESHNINLLVLTDKTRINDINFYLNGMKKTLSPSITYAVCNLGLFSSKESVVSLLEGNNYNGVIIDFHIGDYTNVKDIKDTLKKIDSIIKPISDASRERDYTFIISSLYGMYAQVMDGVVAKLVNFAGKVPCIYQNNEFVKGEYSLGGGNTNDLALTFLTNINDEVKSNKIVKKLSGFDKMMKKK